MLTEAFCDLIVVKSGWSIPLILPCWVVVVLGGLLVESVVVWDGGWEGLTAAEHFGVWVGGFGGCGGLDLCNRWMVDGC